VRIRAGTADEGQKNATYKVRKGLKGEDEANETSRCERDTRKQCTAALFEMRERWHKRDEVRVCVGVCVCVGEERPGMDTDECGGAGTDLGRGRPAEFCRGVAGVNWHCGGGHMEGRLALWLPPGRAPADGGRLCQEGRERWALCVERGSKAAFGASEDLGY